jgi:hypothetical protein
MFNCIRINETVAAIASGYRPESAFIAEAEQKLGKPVDEHKWNKAKSLAEKELGKKTGDQFYAYTMGIYKKMMGEATQDEKDPRIQIPYKKGHYQVTFTPKKGEKRIRRIYQGDDMEATFAKAKDEIKKDHPESHGYAIHSPQTDESIKEGEAEIIVENDEAKHSTTKDTHIDHIKVGDLVVHDGKVRTVGSKDLKHDSFMGKTLWGDSYKSGKTPVKKVVKYRQSADESVNEAEGTFRKTQEFVSKDGQHAWRAGKNQTAGTWDHRHYVKKGNGWEHVKDHGYDGHDSAEDAAAAAKADCEFHDKKGVKEVKESEEGEEKYRVGGHKKLFTLSDAKKKAEEIHQKTGIIVSVEKANVKESEEVEDKTKKADTDHDEAKEEKEDPTREKLETAKDEADEKKGGPAELAADLRVSIRLERMGLGRYKRMLSKHELSAADEKWLKRRMEDLEACIKDMEAKLPELEKKAEGGAVKEAMTTEIKAVIFEMATGNLRSIEEGLKVHNKSSGNVEDAEHKKCPRCKGFGGTTGDKDGEDCHVCDGQGYVAISKTGSGWLRPKHSKLHHSRLY